MCNLIYKVTRNRLFTLIFVALLASWGATAGAQGYQLELASDAATELTLAVGKSEILRTPQRLGQVVVGNPEIADVKLLSSRQILILGKEPGQTNLVLRDKGKKLVALIDLVVGFDINAIKRKIHDVLPGEDHLEVRASNDSIVLSGDVSSALAMESALAVAKSYAGKKVINSTRVGGGQQVLLEARIAEIARSSLKELGAETAYQDLTFNPDGTVKEGTNAFTGLFPINPFGIIEYFGSDANVRLSGLETLGLAKILAEPNLVALSGQEAEFLVGGEFPVPVAQSGTLTNVITVVFKEFGIGLRFTPTVLSSRKINLKLKAEVSAIDTSTSFVSEVSGINIGIPGISTRRASTTVELGDGQSFAIAGLLQNDIENVIDQLPGLGNLPVLGALFRSTEFQRQETELVIVVTPRLVKPVPAGTLALPTDGYLPPTDIDQYLLGRLEGRLPEPAETATEGDEPAAPAASAESAKGGLEGSFGHQL